jgi:hypothetical protein
MAELSGFIPGNFNLFYFDGGLEGQAKGIYQNNATYFFAII